MALACIYEVLVTERQGWCDVICWGRYSGNNGQLILKWPKYNLYFNDLQAKIISKLIWWYQRQGILIIHVTNRARLFDNNEMLTI